jgi:hypothetical protein
MSTRDDLYKCKREKKMFIEWLQKHDWMIKKRIHPTWGGFRNSHGVDYWCETEN